jgi:protein O-mannosyl-transferase
VSVVVRSAPSGTEPRWSPPGSQPYYRLALVLLVLVVFGQTWQFEFLKLDDNQYVTENPQVLAGLSPASIRWAFTPTGYAANWHPLVWLSLMLDAELFGAWAGGFHGTNVLLHAVNTLLLFGLFCRLTGESARSFVVAGLFAVHPLHVESVAWISERKDVLSTLFGLLSLIGYVRFVEQRHVGWYVTAWCCLLLSLLSKQMLVTLPCVLLLLDFWPLKRLTLTTTTPWRLIVEKLPFVALSAVFCLVAVWAQAAGEALSDWERLPWDVRVGNAVVSYVIYLRQTFWPASLAVFYPYPNAGQAAWAVAACAVLLIGVTVVTLLHWRRRPYLLTGWLWYLVTLLPVIGIVQVGEQAHADRYMYFPLIGLAFAATWWVADALSSRSGSPRAAGALATAVLLVMSVLAWNQTRHWRDSASLFRHALQVTDDNWLAHATLAAALMDVPAPERVRQAELHLREALRIKPNYATAHYNLALVLSDLGDLSQANGHFREALALKPDHLRARLLLCLNLKRLGQFEELARELAELDARHASFPLEVQPALDALRSR